MAILIYEELVASLNAKIKENGNKEITGPILNSYLQDVIETAVIKHIVADEAERNSITSKYPGMRVFVQSENKTYELKGDLTTWILPVTDAYSQSEVDGLLNDKVDKVAGKGLSTNDFTNPDKAKLDSVEADATANQTDAYLLNRANHTGEQAITTITGLELLLNGVLEDIVELEEGVNISYKNIELTTEAVFEMGERQFTVISVPGGSDNLVVLPDADINNGRIVVLKKGSSAAGKVVVKPFDYQESNSTSNDFQLIEGQWDYELDDFGDTVTLQAKSGRWYIISSYIQADIPVTSVNGQTGAVNLDADNIDPTTNRNYVTDAELSVVQATSGTNTGDEVDATISVKGIVELADNGEEAPNVVVQGNDSRLIFGTQYGYIERTTIATTTGAQIIYTTLVTGDLPAGNYVLEAGVVIRNSDTSGDFWVDVTEGGGAAGTNTSLLDEQMREEAIDAGADQRYNRNITRDIALTAGVKSINLEIDQFGAGTTTVYFGYVRLFRRD